MKLYRCSICGNIVDKVVDVGVPVMCCGKPMEELVPNTVEAATEKHLPVGEIKDDVLTVKVGEVEHPMLDEHYITTILVVLGKQVLRADLKPGEEPKTSFALNGYKGLVEIYEYCNLHGLWKTELHV